jgi:molybdopterin synthase sulfur carrier subunit
MVTVRFFASIRERLDASQVQLSLAHDVEAAIDILSSERGAQWGEVLRAANVIIAINQSVTNRNALLHDGDELAFFPPVTGG